MLLNVLIPQSLGRVRARAKDTTTSPESPAHSHRCANEREEEKESRQPRFQRSFDGVRLFEREHEIQISVDMHRAANPDKFLWWENTAGINFPANPDNILWWINSAGNTP